METEIKLSFLKRLKMSLLDFDKYHIIASEGLGRAMLYLVRLMLVFTLIMSFAFTLKVSQLITNGTTYIKEQTPNFYFKDDEFHIESDSDVILENNQYVKIKLILSNSDTYDESNIQSFDGIGIVFLKNKILLKQENGTSIIARTYKEVNEIYNVNNLNKETILGYFDGENGYTILAHIFAIIFITVFITYFMTAILDTLALSLLGYIVSRMIRVPLKYSAIYSLSISAITLPVVINLIYMIVNLFIGFVIPYFQVMYTLVSYICLIAALLIMRSEIIKKKVMIQVQIMNKEKEQDEEQQKPTEEEKKDENDEDKQEDLKGKVEDKIKGNKDKPEPQANIK